MMENYPSIFNDVIGPVMRGPSSSHCAAALRIGRLCRDLMGGHITTVNITFDPDGSLATTHKSQGSDMGLFGGLLGWDPDDERLPESASYLEAAGIVAEIVIGDTGYRHPNTYNLVLANSRESRQLTAISTGGGMIEVVCIDGVPLSTNGDFYETLIYSMQPDQVVAYLHSVFSFDHLHVHEGPSTFIRVQAQRFPEEVIWRELETMDGVQAVKLLSPVLPVLSRRGVSVPFIDCAGMLVYNEGMDLPLWELAVHYECQRGNISGEEVLEKMRRIVRIMRNSIHQGLKGTQYADRLLGSQSVHFKKQYEEKKLIEGDVLNRVIMYVSAMMEVKSSMGVIVAAPTAGSCGALPGAVIGMAESYNIDEDLLVKAMMAAAMIGVFICAHATFAAEVGGCQAECGSGAAMASAALVYLHGGSLHQSLSAASLALQNSLGMICDPVANRVEAPCLGKNVLAATNAISCANMALANYDHLIPLDEVIVAMDQVGNSMPHALRCTNLGGLSITPTAKRLELTLQSTSSAFKSC